MTGPDSADRGRDAVTALREAAARPSGPLRALVDEAIDYLDVVLREQPAGTVAAVAVPIAVFASLNPALPPPGLLAAAGATYLALSALDDQMDAAEPTFWGTRQPSEVVLGAQVLLQLAGHVIADGAAPSAAERMRALYRSMIADVIEGQLLSAPPLTEATTPKAVAAAISARSGAMLAGFAAMAAVAAGAEERALDAARTFGHELGVARQHLNDLTELVGDEMDDLRNRTATLATALALQPLSPAGRRRLIDTMHAAAQDPSIRRRLVVEELATAISEVVFVIQLHLRRARLEAAVLGGSDRAPDGLRNLMELTAAPLRRSRV
jgi:geranylgeranyl pyrophosphate synthase